MILAVIVTAASLLSLGTLLVFRQRRVCLRRKDCCGKGCGCLFPVRRK